MAESIVLFDRQGCVVEVSRTEQSEHVGQFLNESWVQPCLHLADEQAYGVSAYEASRFYDGRSTFVYAAAVRDFENGAVLGGVAIVWDAVQQIQSILDDCAQGMGASDALAFVGPEGVVQHAGQLKIAQQGAHEINLDSQASNALREMNGHYYAVGQSCGTGYREFRACDGFDHGLRCLMLHHLCARETHRAAPVPQAFNGGNLPAEHRLLVATFMQGSHWLGVPAHWVVQAAADAQVLQAGQMRSPFLGMAQIGGRAYGVIDLRQILDSNDPGRAAVASRAADAKRQFIHLRVALDADTTVDVLLRVDVLGPMLDIDIRDRQTLRGATQGLVDSVVTVDTDEGKKLLSLISQAWVQRCATG